MEADPWPGEEGGEDEEREDRRDGGREGKFPLRLEDERGEGCVAESSH